MLHWRICFQVGLLYIVVKLVLVVNGRIQFFFIWTLSQAVWMLLQHGSWLPPEWVIQKRVRQKWQCLLWPSLRCHIVISATFYSLEVSPVHIQREESWASSLVIQREYQRFCGHTLNSPHLEKRNYFYLVIQGVVDLFVL